MNKRTNTILAVLLGLVLLALLLAAPWLIFRQGGDFGWTFGPGMMGRNFAFHMPFGVFAVLFVWLLPMVIIGLLIAGAVAAIVNLTRPKNSAPPSSLAPPAESTPSPAQHCPQCARPVESNWVACPYCGASLKTG